MCSLEHINVLSWTYQYALLNISICSPAYGNAIHEWTGDRTAQLSSAQLRHMVWWRFVILSCPALSLAQLCNVMDMCHCALPEMKRSALNDTTAQHSTPQIGISHHITLQHFECQIITKQEWCNQIKLVYHCTSYDGCRCSVDGSTTEGMDYLAGGRGRMNE